MKSKEVVRRRIFLMNHGICVILEFLLDDKQEIINWAREIFNWIKKFTNIKQNPHQ